MINEIDVQYKEYLSEKKNISIIKNNNPIEQLEILEKESKIRLNNDYYNDAIECLLILFNTKLDISFSDYESKYKKELEVVINELFLNLQNMNIVDLETDYIISPDYKSELFYELSKLIGCIHENKNDPLFGYYLDRINECSNKEIILNTFDSKEELYLKIKIIMYYKMWS